jgi:sulfate transport system ATP-binding protein
MSVVVKNLTKFYSEGGSPAVADVSFEAPEGGITALLGPSGAGKSTVLRLVAGLEEPDSGTIELAGEDVTRTPVQKRGVGLVFQNYALFDHMTVRDNVAFGLAVRGRPRAEQDARVDELLRLVQLADLARRFPTQLSGGQRQRVAFARARAVKPKVLLLDEPFGALDARVRQDLREWLHALHEETGVTTLMVTHDQTEALELAEHVVVMFDGKVAQAAAPGAIYDAPASPQVASFVGGVNVLKGSVKGGRAHAGPVAISVDDAEDGAEVQAFVRPHDVKLARPSEGTSPVSLATVERLKRVGGYVKVSLVLPGGERLTVETPRAELDALGIGEGDRVLVDTQEAKVFVGDYAI